MLVHTGYMSLTIYLILWLGHPVCIAMAHRPTAVVSRAKCSGRNTIAQLLFGVVKMRTRITCIWWCGGCFCKMKAWCRSWRSVAFFLLHVWRVDWCLFWSGSTWMMLEFLRAYCGSEWNGELVMLQVRHSNTKNSMKFEGVCFDYLNKR